MISEEEWRRTEEFDENYLIGDNLINDESKSYNSYDSLMEDAETYDFLKNKGVI
jgi:hypothetical protein